ncbi:MAG: MerR family transcriptional regulator [Armatimonadetes bacterium]|nr:MerR family transcriptional regulator [Armatimonadota bacterium]
MSEPEQRPLGRRDTPVYAIGVAAAMVESHPQTLRMYERTGLVVPQRTRGNARLYSDRDLERVHHVQTYTAMGVNLAGIEIIFRLLDRIEQLESALGNPDNETPTVADEERLTEELRARLRGARDEKEPSR